MYRYDVGLPANAGDRRDVADEIETKLVIERGVDGIPTADHEQRVAVRRSTHDRLCADIAAAARSVLDNKLLTEPLRQPLSHQTRDDVGRTGRSERHDDADGPRRVALRPRDAGYGRQRGSARGQMQKLSAGKFHFEPPFTSFDHLVGAGEQRGRHIDTESLGGPAIYYQLELRWLDDRQVTGFLAFENPSHIQARLLGRPNLTRSIANQTARFGKLARRRNRGNGMAGGENDNFNTATLEEGVWTDEQRTSLLLRELRKRGTEAPFTAGAHDQNLLPDGACRRLQISHIDLDIRIIGVQ